MVFLSLNFLKNLHVNTIFHSNCTNLQSHQQCIWVLFTPHSHQHLLCLIFVIVILTDVRWHLILVLICIFLIINNIEHLYMCLCMVYIYILWKNVYPGGLLVLKLGYFLFVLSFMSSLWAFPGASDCNKSACNVIDRILIPGSGRYPGKGNGNPLQYSCLEDSMDRKAWKATVPGVAKSQTQLSD